MDVSLIAGNRHEDARGALRFVNGFDMTPVKRFYTISNSVADPKRGWIMHKRETKWFFPLRGVTEVKVRGEGEQWNVQSSYVLDALSPAVLQVSPGHWFCIEQQDVAEIQVFSSCRVGEFANDDFRRPL